MRSDDDDDNQESSQFVKRPHPSGRRSHRPRSVTLGSQIISNPKLVKSLQNLGEGERLTRPVSSINFRVEEAKKFEEQFELNKTKEPSRPSWHKYLGILLALFASFVFSLSSIIVKSISDQYHPYTLSLWTFQGILLPSLAILLFQGMRKAPVCQRIWPLGDRSNLWNFCLVVLRAFCGAGGTVLKVYSLQYMTAADSTVIAFTSPVFVVLAAWVLLDEKFGLVPIVTALLVLVGVGIITRPPWITGEKEFDTDLLIGCSMAFSCMLLGVFTVVILRYIRDVHYAFITFIYGLVGTVGSIALCLYVGRLEAPTCWKHWLYAFLIAKLTFLGQNTLTLALQYEQAGLISLIRPSEIVFTFGWQMILLKKYPDWLSVVGAFVVVSGVLIITARKWISTLQKDNSARKFFKVLLL